MASSVISVERLSKRYQLGQRRSRDEGLRHVLEGALRRPWRALREGRRVLPARTTDFWALQDVSFEVSPGDIVGVIGRNGAGKSTLLKLLSRITEPTSGRIMIDGRVASLLEVGTGFHPELTGRENIFLNGAILGMSRAEIKRQFDEIVAFSEVEKFLETPVKRYSSGMYVRLAFAVAAHLEPEILVVDEVLAVGDIEFQRKCLGKMQSISRQNRRTVLFVSHNVAAISALCRSGLFLRQGQIAAQGEITAVLAAYAGAGERREGGGFDSRRRREAPSACQILNAWLETEAGGAETLEWNEPFRIVMDVKVEEPATVSPEYLIRDRNESPLLFSPTGLQQNVSFRLPPGRHRIIASADPLRLATGAYSFDLILAHSGVKYWDYCESALRFEVSELNRRPHGWRYTQEHGQGALPFELQVQAHPLDPVIAP